MPLEYKDLLILIVKNSWELRLLPLRALGKIFKLLVKIYLTFEYKSIDNTNIKICV
jgi:hypothetical protein